MERIKKLKKAFRKIFITLGLGQLIIIIMFVVGIMDSKINDKTQLIVGICGGVCIVVILFLTNKFIKQYGKI